MECAAWDGISSMDGLTQCRKRRIEQYVPQSEGSVLGGLWKGKRTGTELAERSTRACQPPIHTSRRRGSRGGTDERMCVADARRWTESSWNELPVADGGGVLACNVLQARVRSTLNLIESVQCVPEVAIGDSCKLPANKVPRSRLPTFRFSAQHVSKLR